MSGSCNRPLQIKDYWPHFENAGALNAWVIDSGGDVERARSQAFQLKQDRYPCIEYPEVIDEQHVQGLSKFLEAIGSSNHINAVDAAGSLNCDAWKLARIGITVNYVRNARSKARSQRRELSQSRSCTYQCPKMIVKLGAAALDLTPECKARLEELRKSPNDLNQWRLFNEEFGLFVCPIVTFGGAIYTDRSLERVSEWESDQQEGSNKASGDAMFQSGPLLRNLDMKFSAHSKDGQSQGSSSTFRSATKAGLWVKFGGRNPNSNFQEWIEELNDLTTWRIIRRSKPIMLLDMIPGIPGMEWVRDRFQLPQHPISSLAEPAVPRLSRSPHFQSHIAVKTLEYTGGNVTLLLFQNSLNHLVLVTLGIFNSFAETPIVDKQIAPGTPLSFGKSDFISDIHVIFTDESHHLRDLLYSMREGRWYEGHLHQSKIRIHHESALLFLNSYLYCQDANGNILRIEMKGDDWLDPLNLHTKKFDALQRAWTGTPISGTVKRYPATQTHDRDIGVVLHYLSSQGKLVRGIDGFSQPKRNKKSPALKNPREPAWRESPWVNTEQEVALYPDFSMAPDHSKQSTPPIVFRTAGGFLNMCWQSKKNCARWVFHQQICQTAPGSRFYLRFLYLHPCHETACIFFFSQGAKLEMIEIDPHVSEDAPYISHRTIVDESCWAKPWDRLITNPNEATSRSESDMSDSSSSESDMSDSSSSSESDMSDSRSSVSDMTEA
ncbi:hypothetical protein DM02DRAFT_677917 [Periconia macrospinosa]|uniref:MACPF domain-containing protein n=1 Tax=Periconia macrospinosa TaxID=97972 RepID=A0A2V1D125_9PLEO|nr:hypothetical protein DM02DRAFT_677917 [Periconia macrospinosa]